MVRQRFLPRGSLMQWLDVISQFDWREPLFAISSNLQLLLSMPVIKGVEQMQI